MSNLNYFLMKEEQLIALEIQRTFSPGTNELKSPSQEEIHLINANLLLTDQNNIAYRVHHQFINSLIAAFINRRFKPYFKELTSVFCFDKISYSDRIIENNIDEIPELVEEIHISFLNSEFTLTSGKLSRKKSKHHLKETGAVYTLNEITKEIVEETIEKAVQKNITADTLTCLDFACGTGRFYFQAIEILEKKYFLSLQNIVCDNLYAVDIDNTALNVLRCKVISLFDNLNSKIINALSSNILNKNALIPKTTFFEVNIESIDLTKDFRKIFENGGFDAIFSNPPYCLLKVNKKGNEQKLNGYYVKLQSKVQSEINFFRTSGLYQYAVEGMLNYYQLSIEMIIRLTKPNGQIGIICPSSLFADLTSSKLRKHLLGSHKLHFIRYYSEGSGLFENVSQSTVIFYLEKSSKTNKIEIEIAENRFQIDLATIKSIFYTNFEIPLIDKTGWSILNKISKHKKIKEYSYIRNRRGELDLTLFKSHITTKNTGWRLVRGNMISDNCVIDKNGEFVKIEGFLNKKSEDFKMHDYNKERLICQQISNVDLQKRLKFVFSEKTDILGNSCNYIVSSRKQSDLKKLYYILNSALLNWRFKITSSNNHINNYELDELPIIDLDSIDLTEFTNDEVKNNEIICTLYGLSKAQTNYISGTMVKESKTTIEYEQETV